MTYVDRLPRGDANTLLIVGNGLNNAVDNSGSWSKLTSTLLRQTRYDSVVGALTKKQLHRMNFISLFQEMSLHWMSKGGTDRKLKEMVAGAMEDFEGSVLQRCELHQQLMNLPCEHICTTNYDYVLEESYLQGDDIRNCNGNDSETTYSLYRCVEVDSRKVVWHIHGERRAPGSINLGHNQYAGYLHYARQYLIKGEDSSGRPRFATLNEKIERPSRFNYECWLDHFFSSPRIIWLGISLPMAEYVLWWLIFYRAEMMQRHKGFYRGFEMHFIDVHGTSDPADVQWQREERNRMLRTAGAIVHDRPATGLGGWEEAYDDIIKDLR